jgi:hypothetical protein
VLRRRGGTIRIHEQTMAGVMAMRSGNLEILHLLAKLQSRER